MVTILHVYINKPGRAQDLVETNIFIDSIRSKYNIIDYNTDGEFGYDDAIKSVWGTDTFIIVEMDCVPTEAQLQDLLCCQHSWCNLQFYNAPIEQGGKIGWQGLNTMKIDISMQTQTVLEKWWRKGEWHTTHLRLISALESIDKLHIHNSVVKHNRTLQFTKEGYAY